MDKKKISIITVTFNLIHAKRQTTFIQMLDSIYMQTYSNIEHIIIDGASTDGSIDFIKEEITKHTARTTTPTQKYTTVFISEPDLGIYNAMNKGIKHATGEYILFMNTDDYYTTPKALELLVNALEKENAELSYSESYIESKTASTTKHKKERVRKRSHKYFAATMIAHNTMLCKKSLLEKYHSFDEEYTLASDYDFFLKVMYNAIPIACVYNTPLLCFRGDGAAMSNSILLHNEKYAILKKYYTSDALFTEKELRLLAAEKISYPIYKKAYSIKDRRFKKSLLDYMHARIFRKFYKLQWF